ncbi:MAG: ABC transporter ATP-binding protein [Chloroflexaceae bacterium]|nr:ABC transporter ATP-binding protein [Chloroflexaceae bacterium]NJO08039.1 ABC transporter ATP-binding protein [Chloroflexaceae bacterium]
MNTAHTTTPPAAISLHLEGIAASYGARTVLSDISLTLQSGEVLIINGPNGSGKSTLLRLLCGLQQPTSGTLFYAWQGRRYAPLAARHLIGWVAPDLALYRELSGHENLRFFASVRGLRCTAAELDAVLARVGLGGRGGDWVGAYSSGMVQRLRYAYALLHAPPVLLLDEPTITLDERGAAVVASLIHAQRALGITVIATNDPRELRFGDYVLTLVPG